MFDMISSLPEEIILYKIRPYLSLEDTYLTNKSDYISHKTEKFTSLYEYKRQSFGASYISKLIRKDYAFLFEISSLIKLIISLMWSVANGSISGGRTFNRSKSL